MITVASKVPFNDFCKVCERISVKSKKDEKRKILSDFIKQWRRFHTQLHGEKKDNGDSFFPALRLLLPQFDRERGVYGIKETMLAKLYINILNLSEDSEDAKKLLNYRAPNAAKGEAGDFAAVAEMVLKYRCPSQGTMKLSDINFHLDNMALCHAEKNKEELKRHFKKLLCNTTAQEQKWLIRVILKVMRFGLSDTIVLNEFHPDSKDLFDVTSSLSKVCTQLHDETVRLHEIEISLFTPFRPMLANRTPPENIEKLMEKNSYLLETKLDGERTQFHKDGNIYKYFSRSGIDYTSNYGDSSCTGSFTPSIAHAFRDDARSLILDGEMMGWNKQLGCMGSKGKNFDVKSLSVSDDVYQPCFCVFDILFYNGKVLSNLPLSERLTYLDGLFCPVEGRLILSKTKEVSTKQDIIDALNKAIDNREEGIMVKNPVSVYKPNCRDWIKVKPEYMENVMNDLDLLIVGGYFGEGRRRGILSHFLLAVAVPSQNPDEPECFHSFTKVGSGYTVQELYQLLDRMKDNWQPYDKQRPPDNIVLASGHKEKPDLWIEPSKSQILQVKASEIISSDRFKTGCTLRFPRVEKVRYDKPWYQCLTVKELQQLKQEAEGKLSINHFSDGEPSAKKKRISPRIQVIKTVPSQFQPADTSGIEQESSIFADKEMCVLTESAQHSKADLEKIIVRLGGSFVQNPGPGTFCVICNKLSLRVNNLICTSKYDIVHADWLQECDEKKKFIPWKPSMMLYSKEETSRNLSLDYDEFGDGFHENTDETELRIIFSKIPDEVVSRNQLLGEKINELELHYFPDDNHLFLFRCLRIYVDDKSSLNNSCTRIENHVLSVVALQLRYHGATITESIDTETTHVLMHHRDTARLSDLLTLNQTREKRFHIVNSDWVRESITAKKRLPEKKFKVPGKKFKLLS